ncbi:GWT1-domain-containing protein [Calycina marina]|uniref:GPI-anchored wall transfer protein n=1 Tax=Calycina marina TaxID=1763456 RepID=A0A9P7Z604_9HELO|nr:GWT1-domain-containing protein [Calycina marina]
MSRVAEAAKTASYKSQKEAFVSGLTGGSISEINYVTAVAPVAVVLWSTLQTRQAFFRTYTPLAFAVDFLLNVGAILLATTLYSKTPVLLILLLLAPTVVIRAFPRVDARKKPMPKTNAKPAQTEPLNPLPKKSFLTTYRGTMLAVTCIAILAVDFKIFPRRFAKVENWGTSLMDVGVGSFVFSAGVVAARPILREQLDGKTTRLGMRLYRSIRHSLPLLILGFIRLYTVKGLDYAEHVTEYGVHWNFFFTLGFLPPFLAVFQSAFQYLPSYAGLAMFLGIAYQIALEKTRLKAFILTAPRTDLISQNREGISSFFGYLAIFLIGQSTGLYILPRNISNGTGNQARKRLLLTLGSWSLVWILSFAISISLNYGFNWAVSRRLANLPYILWIAAFNTTQLSIFCLVETIFFPAHHKNLDATRKSEEEAYKTATSRVLEAYNRNGLFIFLVANLLTGLVNMTVPTLFVSNVQATGVLLVYSAVLTSLALGLDMYDISIKM